MLSQNTPDFDALWDYSHPDQTEAKFRETLLNIPEDDPAFLELLTQIARAQGLQRKFDKAHQTLDQVENQVYFKKAYEVLCQDKWLMKHETDRLKRIKKLGHAE